MAANKIRWWSDGTVRKILWSTLGSTGGAAKHIAFDEACCCPETPLKYCLYVDGCPSCLPAYSITISGAGNGPGSEGCCCALNGEYLALYDPPFCQYQSLHQVNPCAGQANECPGAPNSIDIYLGLACTMYDCNGNLTTTPRWVVIGPGYQYFWAEAIGSIDGCPPTGVYTVTCSNCPAGMTVVVGIP